MPRPLGTVGRFTPGWPGDCPALVALAAAIRAACCKASAAPTAVLVRLRIAVALSRAAVADAVTVGLAAPAPWEDVVWPPDRPPKMAASLVRPVTNTVKPMNMGVPQRSMAPKSGVPWKYRGLGFMVGKCKELSVSGFHEAMTGGHQPHE